jgi:adenylate kinase
VDTCHFPETRHGGTLSPTKLVDGQVPIDAERGVTAGRFSVTLMMGAPGAGKGTQATFACESLDVPHVATGDLLREHQRRGTTLGTTAREYMDRGDLVPDNLVMGMLIERLQQADAANGALLDGFPRTLSQAHALDDGLGAHGGGVRAVVYLDVPTDVLVRRLSGRRACAGCEGTFNVDLQQLPDDGSCPTCGDQLVHRRDDEPSVVAHRVQVYLQETAPVLAYYREEGLVRAVDGNRSVDEIKSGVLQALKQAAAPLPSS